jgi:hypothetical protein
MSAWRFELLLVDEDVGILELDLQLLGVGHEVGREIAAVELHALDRLKLGREALGLFDGDDTLIADLFHRFCEDGADFGIAIGRDGRDLGDLAVGRDLLGMRLEILDDRRHGEVDAALQVHGVHPRRDRLRAFAHDGLGQHGGGGRAVTGLVVLLVGDLAQHLCAHILELVLQFDFLGDRDAVLGDTRRAEALLDDHIAALGTERHLDGVGQRIDAAQHAIARPRRTSLPWQPSA